MPRAAADARRRGRRGRRTALIVRSARARIDDLFGLAVLEGRRGPSPLADRYVALARAVGTRYNIRVPREYRELYCRRCSTYWTEGRTVRTRLRGAHRVRTCLACGALRRLPLANAPSGPSATVEAIGRDALEREEVLAEEPSDLDEEAAELGSEDEE